MTWFQKPPLGTPLDWENPLNKGTALALAMNEGHGDKVQNLSMNGNHGTLNGFAFPPTAASGWNPGQTGVGLNFDGTSDYVDCGNDVSLNISSAITISAWVKSSEAKQGLLLGRASAPDYKDMSYSFRINADNSITIITGDGINWNAQQSANAIVEQDKCVLVTITYDETNVVFYKNGVISSTHAYPFGLHSIPGRLSIGKNYNLWYFNGSISDVRIHNRALSAKEVRDYYINPYSVYLDEDD